jgi:S1-C subfamily serine protease
MRLALGIALLVLASGCATERPWTPAREQILQRILPSTVQVVLEREGRRFRTASGVVIGVRPTAHGVECYVLTSGHTLSRRSGQENIYVLLDRERGLGAKAPATVIAARETDDLDLGLLRVNAGQCPVARLGAPPTLGEQIWVVTFPWGRNMTLVGGNISQVDSQVAGDPETTPRLMVDASVSYGASGGGVFDAYTGRLLGLVESYRTARVQFEVDTHPGHIDVPVPGETYVTPLADIRRFLSEAGYADLIGLGSVTAKPVPYSRP